MHKVITISLNGHAYQVEEAGYDAIVEYLAGAERALQANPDRAEIMADLEQAIAEKCQAFLGPQKTVVSVAEVTGILAQMGPVEDQDPANSAGKAGGASNEDDAAAGASRDRARRLSRLPDGAMVAGVCTGLAAFFRIDVALVRAAFVAATFLTKGTAILAYLVMMFVIPEASTPEERAATSDAPFNAREVIERAKKRSSETGREWRRAWQRQQRAWRRQWVHWGPRASPPSPFAAALVPIFSLAHLLLFVLTMAMVISLVTTGEILDWRLPPDMPTWGGVLILFVAYQFVVSPLRLARQWTWYPAHGAGPLAFWNAVAWLIGVGFGIWLAAEHIPEITEFLRRLPDLVRDFAWDMRELFDR